jgi:hypothetical protein
MAKIHMVLQGKGGVGKSLIAAILAQYNVSKGKQPLCIDTLITGSQALTDTVNGFAQLATQFPTESSFIVWLNPYWGAIEYEGKSFEQMKAYINNKSRVTAIIKMPTLKEETYGRDLADMLQEHLTFDEALANSALTIMTRQRLKIVKSALFAQLDNSAVL